MENIQLTMENIQFHDILGHKTLQSLLDSSAHPSHLLTYIALNQTLPSADIDTLEDIALPPNSLLHYIKTYRIEEATMYDLSRKWRVLGNLDFSDYLPSSRLTLDLSQRSIRSSVLIDAEHDPGLKQLTKDALSFSPGGSTLSEAAQLELVDKLKILVETRTVQNAEIVTSILPLTAASRSPVIDALVFKYLGDSVGLRTRVRADTGACSVLLWPDLEEEVHGENQLFIKFAGFKRVEDPLAGKLEGPVNLGKMFKFNRKVGQGAFGEVWDVLLKHPEESTAYSRVRRKTLAEMSLTRRHFALKIVPEEKCGDAEEAVFMRLCGGHANVLGIHAVFSGFQRIVDRSGAEIEEHSLCFLLDLKDANLDDLISEGELSGDDKIKILRDAAAALSYLHADLPLKPPVVFRDFKPQNVLVACDDQAHTRAYLSDFGLARLNPAAIVGLTSEPGTLEFMAPEQLTRNYGRPVDVWAFGITMQRLLTSAPESRFSHPTTESRLWELQGRCVNKDPLMRPSMEQVKREIETIIVAEAWHSASRVDQAE